MNNKPEHDEATLEYYAVRIYRRYQDKIPEATRLAGIVEDVEGFQHAFHSQEELWQLLLNRSKRQKKVQ